MPARTRLPRTVLVLGAVSALHDFAADMVTPLMPAFLASLGAGPAALGIIEGIADATSSVLKLLSGAIADRVGRLKTLTALGYIVPNALRPCLALAASWWQVLAIRFGDRLGKGIRGAPRDALVAAVTPAEMRGRAYGYHLSVEYLGATLGPLAAFALIAAGLPLRRVFALSAIPGAMAILVLLSGVTERAPKSRPSRIKLGLPDTPGYRRLLAAAAIFSLGNSSDAFLLWRARELGVRTEWAPVLWTVLHLVKSGTSLFGGHLNDRIGRRIAVRFGWLIYAAVYAGLGFATMQWQIWALMAAYGLYYGLTEGALKALVVDLVDEADRGRALGTYSAVTGLALLPASIAFGAIYRAAGPRDAFGLGALLAVAAIAILPGRLVRPPAASR